MARQGRIEARSRSQKRIGFIEKLVSFVISHRAAEPLYRLKEFTTNLGFRPAEAGTAVAAAGEELGADATLDALVRLALKKAGK